MLPNLLLSSTNYSLYNNSVFFFFQLPPLGFATVDHLPPSYPITWSSFITPALCRSSFTKSMNLIWDFPLFLLAGSFIFSILFPIYPLPLLCTCLTVSKLLSLSCVSDIFISNLIWPSSTLPASYSALVSLYGSKYKINISYMMILCLQLYVWGSAFCIMAGPTMPKTWLVLV